MTLLLVTMAGEPEGPLVIGTLQSAGRISVRNAFAIVRIWNAPGVSGTRARRQGHDPNAYYIPTRGTNDAARPRRPRYTPSMRPEDLRRWVAGRQAAEDRQRDEPGGTAPAPAVAWSQALSLIDLVGRLVGWPPPEDDIRQRETRHASEQWARVRASLGWRR
jgi:hypothetical protein